MGKLLSYSGISTKIRAMQSKLITEDQIQEMLQFTSTSHAAAWLKRTPEYSKTWASLDENSLHRGQIEKLLKHLFSMIFQRSISLQAPNSENSLICIPDDMKSVFSKSS